MSSNDPTMTANGPSQKHSSQSNPSPAATTPKNPSIDSDTKHLPPRLIGTGLSGVPRLPTPGNPSVSVSANNSNNSSRETSPVRLTSRVLSTHNHHTAATHRSLSRAKNSSSPSPSRGTSGTGPTSTPTTTVSSTLSPAAVQKAFAQLGKPDLQRSPVLDKNLDVSDPERASMPPPRTSRRRTSIGNGSRSPSLGSTTSRRPESTASESLANISTKRTSVSPEEGRVSPSKAAYDDHEASARRPSGRAAAQPGTTLETVQEFSVPSTPIALPEGSVAGNLPIKGIDTNQQVVESGSESGGNKSSGSKEGNEARRSSIKARPTGAILPQKSFTSLKSGRGKPSDGSVRNMIVETETVSSIPQVSLGVGAGGSSRNDQGGTVRMKPSVETIRPKKEKKKATRKPVNPPGTASSKADIFEAKVASAIDDADVSDSDETFVYESNPPEPLPNRHRYHSRTPSATSMASQAEQFTNRPRLSGKDGSGITVKRSMKFTNNHHANVDNDSGDMDQRSVSGRAETNAHSGRHHHIGRHGRGGAHPSLFDSDSPFPQSQQQPRSPRHYISNGFHQNRRGNTPRTHPNYRTIGGPKSMSDEYLDDFDADGADDERTPLVSSARLSRNRNGRRPGSASMRQMEFLEHRQRNRLSTYGGCFLAVFLIFMLICGAATFLAALMRPLAEVQITRLSNVLASEQELILDVHVSAINPNIFPISIETMDVDIFARSRYVGSDKFWRDHGPHPGDFPRVERSKFRAHLAQRARLPARDESNSFSSDMNSSDGVDHGTDPIPFPDDPSSDVGKMRLGRVFRFDSPVLLDPSPWRRHSSESVGEIRLLKPGNKTEEGGTERWERVLQHPFELDVRGVFKYSLPLTSSVRSAIISARIQVLPDDGSDHGNEGDGSDKEGNVLVPGASGNEDVRIDFQ